VNGRAVTTKAISRQLIAVLVASLGCGVAGAKRGVPLYSGARGAVDQVASLYGPIATVDGQDVSSQGDAFELRVGCHVVTTKTQYLEHDLALNTGATLGAEPTLTFAIQMRPGFSYAFEHRTQDIDGVTGRGWMTARELDRAGKARGLQPTQDAATIAACRGS
jgi:hypothetical protein